MGIFEVALMTLVLAWVEIVIITESDKFALLVTTHPFDAPIPFLNSALN